MLKLLCQLLKWELYCSILTSIMHRNWWLTLSSSLMATLTRARLPRELVCTFLCNVHLSIPAEWTILNIDHARIYMWLILCIDTVTRVVPWYWYSGMYILGPVKKHLLYCIKRLLTSYCLKSSSNYARQTRCHGIHT